MGEAIEILSKYRPSTDDKLKQIGEKHSDLITNAFITKYGEYFLRFIGKFCEDNALSMDVSDTANNDQLATTTKQEPNTLNGEDLNVPIIIPLQVEAQMPNIPEITAQTKQIYEAFEYGQSISDISKQRTISRCKIERCLADCTLNGYKMDWNRFSFSIA